MKNILLKLFILVTVLSLILPAFSAGAAEEPKNLITSSTTAIKSETATFENGVFKQSNKTGEHLALITTPGLINQYTWSGDVKILDYGNTSAAAGIRICIGYDETTEDYFNLIITRSAGISAERRGTAYESDVYPITKDDYSAVLDPGAEFSFEINKQGNYVSLKIDDKVVMNTSFPSKYDFFTPGQDANLGFYSANCSFEVSNMKVYNSGELLFNPESTLDFEALNDGTLAKGQYNNWYIQWPSTNNSVIETADSNKHLKITGYFQGVYGYRPTEDYSFNFNMLATNNNQNVGIFARASRERFLTNSAGAQYAEYFEADGAGSIGGTGIFLKPLNGNNIVLLAVKQYDEASPKKIKSQTVTIDISSVMGEKTFLTGITNVRFDDNGSEIKIYIDDNLIATVELSAETVTYPTFATIVASKLSTETYVKTVVVKNAAGDTLLTVDNTLVSADYSVFGIGVRGMPAGTFIYIDDLKTDIDMVKLDLPAEPETPPETNPQTADVYTGFVFIALISLCAALLIKKTGALV